MFVKFRSFFLFPLLSLVMLVLALTGGRMPLPAAVRQQQLSLEYGVPPALAGSSLNLQQLARILGHPGSEPTQLTLPTGSTASNSGPRLIFPHFGDGQAPQIGRIMQTTVNLLNDTEYTAQVTLSFFDDAGKPLSVKIGNQTASQFTFNIAAGRSARFLTAGAGTLKSGWIRVTSDQPVAGNCSFSLSDAKGWVRTDVGVAESALATEFTLFADTIGSATTGLALVNPDDKETVNLELELRSLAGASLSTFRTSLGPGAHWARFIPEIFNKVSGISEFEGSLVVRGNHPFAGITLRSVGALLTSVPLLPAPAPDLIREKLLFPQIADGTAGNLKAYTTILLMNNTNSPASGTVVFRNSSGALMDVKIGSRTASDFSFNLATGAVQRLTTRAAGNSIQAGWAEVTTDQPLGGAAIFHIAQQSDQIISEAGVTASLPAKFLNLVADSLGVARTGIAVANPSDENISISLQLFDLNGVKKGTKSVDLAPYGHQSLFVDQLFPAVSGINELYGSVRLVSGDLFSAMSLRQVDTLTTSLPILWPQHGFAPVSVFEFTQNLAGTAPTLRWRFSQSGNDLSVSGATVSAPDLGLDLSQVAVFDSVAWGFWFISLGANSFGGTAEVILTSKQPPLFEVRAMGGLASVFGITELPLASGELSGSTAGGLALTLNPLTLGMGSWNQGIGAELDLFLRPRIIKAPAAAKEIRITADFASASAKPDEAGVPVLRRTVQPQSIVTAQGGTPRLDRILPVLPVPGQILTLEGAGFNATSEVVFSDSDGNDLRVPPISSAADRIEVLVPPRIADGPVSIENGAVRSNAVTLKLLFQPVPELLAAGAGGAQGVPLKFVIDQKSAQLAMAGFRWTIWNANRSLAGLVKGTELGTALLRVGGQVTQQQVIKVGASSADSLNLELLKKGSESTLVANLTITPAQGTVTGLQFAYLPSEAITGPMVIARDYQWEINLTGLPVQVGIDGSPGVSWSADVRSYPPGAPSTGESTAIHVIISK